MLQLCNGLHQNTSLRELRYNTLYIASVHTQTQTIAMQYIVLTTYKHKVQV